MKRILASLLICLITFTSAKAIVVQSIPTDVKQSDGTILTVIPFGDERVSWYRTTDNYTLMIAENHDFVYAIEDGNGGMKCSDVIAHNPKNRNQMELNFISNIPKKLFYSEEQVGLMKRFINANIDYSKKLAKVKANSNGTEDYKMIVILMSFSDIKFSTPKEDVENLFNQVGYSQNGHPGSVHDYFVASSSGKLSLSATVVGPYVSDSIHSYYGKKEGNINDIHVRELIKEAVKKASNDVDFSLYTNGDPDNKVSCVYVLYAGYAQSSNINYPDLIWPHRSKLGAPIILNNAKIQDYGCSSELEGWVGGKQPMKIGTICHEFSHVLGQPDYYDTDYELHGRSWNPGKWDLMASGNYNGNGAFPPTWHTMERTVRNYVTLEEGEIGQDYTLEELSKSAKAIKLRYDGFPNEYLLLENRQQTSFDNYLPGHGLLIFKLNKNNTYYWNNNCVNCDSTHLGFELMTANEATHTAFYNGEYNYNAGQPFPGITNKHSFTDETSPSSKSADGYNLNKPVYRIMENSNTKNITFHIGDTTNFAIIYNVNINYGKDTIKPTAEVNAYSLSTEEKGFLYSENSNPTDSTATKKIDNTSSNNTIKVDITELEHSKTYYLRPYVKTSNGYSYGEIVTIKVPCASITSFPYEEDFSNGITECWSEENPIYSFNNWKITENGNSAYISTDFAWQNTYSDGYYNKFSQPRVKLITPAMDITVLDKPIVKFRHYQKTKSNKTDNLKIYYKTSLTDSWILLKEYTDPINNWQEDSIELPVKSATLYIGFEAALNMGDGIYLDSIIVTDKSINSWPQLTFTSIKDITDEQATFNANITSAGFTNLIHKGFVLSTQHNPTINDKVIYANNTQVGNYELLAEELESSTEYFVRAFAQNSGLITYSQEQSFTTKCARIKDFPYTPDLSSADTICFDKEEKLILPILDLSNKDSMAVIYNITKLSSGASTTNIEVYYRNGVNGQWESLNAPTLQSNQTITVSIPTTNHQNAISYIAFSGLGKTNTDYKLNSIAIKAVSQIAFLSTDSISLTAYNKVYAKGTITYAGMKPVSQRGFVYSKTNNPTIDDNKIEVGNGIGSFNTEITNLEPLTTYYIRAFATNDYGTAYGNVMQIKTPYITIFNNTITDNQEICAGAVPTQLNGSTPTGGNGTYEFLWISSTNSINWQECNEGSINNNKWYEPRQLFQTTYYKRIVTSYVSVDTSDMVTITVYPNSKGGNVFSEQTKVEQNQEIVLQVRAFVGDILYWERLRPGYDWTEVENSANLEYFTDKPEDIGMYSYRTVIKSGVCNSAKSGAANINVVEGVGFNNINNISEIVLSPNPTKDIVSIDVKDDIKTTNVKITITDAEGNIVYSQFMDLQQGNNILNLHKLNSGTYFITVKGGDIYKNLKLIISK